jgi:hypothetical protein
MYERGVALLHTKCYLIIYKGAGKFFISKDLDAYILNILFNYKVIKNRSGFPENALEKVIKGLKDNHISYQLIYENQNPIIKNYKKANKYESFASKASKNISIEESLKTFEEKIKSASDDDLKKILEYINDNF